jgi:hypothetical protein
VERSRNGEGVERREMGLELGGEMGGGGLLGNIRIGRRKELGGLRELGGKERG